MNVRKKLLLVFCGVVCVLLAGGAILEIWCRLTHKAQLQPCCDPGLNRRRGEFMPSGNVMLGWQVNPKNYTMNCAGYHLNSQGFADREYEVRKESNVYRIVVLGDSITEQGWYVKYLEGLMNKSGLPATFEVWNCGVGEYSVSQYYYLLKEKVLRYHPDMVIIGFCLNDFAEAPVVSLFADGAFMSYSNPLVRGRHEFPFRISAPLFFHSYAYRYLIFAIHRSLNRDTLLPNYFFAPENPKGMVENMLRSIRNITERNHVKLVTAIIPLFKKPYHEIEQKKYSEMKELFHKNDIRCIDLYSYFPDLGDISWRWNSRDYSLPSEKGHKIIGQKIYDYLMAERDYWYKK